MHAILLKSLPDSDPKSLYRVGDHNDCCVNGGYMSDEGDFDIFSYDLYRQLADTTPEFEELAAFQAGNNMMNVRIGLGVGRSGQTEYVSGNDGDEVIPRQQMSCWPLPGEQSCTSGYS